VDYLKTITLKIITVDPAKMFSMDSYFWRYKVYADIRGVLKFLCKLLLTAYD